MKTIDLCFFVLTGGILLAAAGCGGNDTSGSNGGTGGTTATGGTGTGGQTSSGGTTVGGGGAGGTTVGGGGSGGACAGFTGQATKAEIALSPFGDPEAEVLAIDASGKIVAPQHVYDRIVADVAAIRATTQEVQAIHAMTTWSPTNLILGFDPDGLAAVAAGTYTGWDCPNEWYGMTSYEVHDTFVLAKFAHDYNPELLADDYTALPNLPIAEPNMAAGDGDDICVSIENDKLYHYVFDHGSGDCPAGCINHTYWGFTTDGTSLTPLGTFTNQDPAPAWYSGLPDCTKWL